MNVEVKRPLYLPGEKGIIDGAIKHGFISEQLYFWLDNFGLVFIVI